MRPFLHSLCYLIPFASSLNGIRGIQLYKEIPMDEDISYEMTVNDKRYEAAFYQIQGGSMSLQANTETPGQSVLQTGSIPILSLRIVSSVRIQSQMIRGAGRT